MAVRRADVVAAALGILDQFGLADLTMRRVGSALEVKAGALYWHFPNKQSLLAAVADEVLDRFVEPGDELVPGEWLRGWAVELRRCLLRHRDAAELVASARAMDLGDVDPRAAGRALLAANGIGPARAEALMQTFWHFLLGHVVEEQTRSQLAELGVMSAVDPSRSEWQFEVGLDLLVAGLASNVPA